MVLWWANRGHVTYICVSLLGHSSSHTGSSLVRRRSIIWTNAGLCDCQLDNYKTNLSEHWIKIHQFSHQKMNVKMLSVERRSFCFDLNMLSSASYKEQKPKFNHDSYTIYTMCTFSVIFVFLVVISWVPSGFVRWIYPNASGAPLERWNNRMLVPVPVKWAWRLLVKASSSTLFYCT